MVLRRVLGARGRAEEAKWNRKYEVQERLKEFMAPAYNDAVAPFVAAAIHSHNAPRVRVLVLAGGKGSFSSRLLPDVKRRLAENGVKTSIDVVETDITTVLRHATGKRVIADMQKLPFKDRAFDFVVSQAGINQLGPGGLPEGMAEVNRVLTPAGIFIHVQDTTPDLRSWCRPESIRAWQHESAAVIGLDKSNTNRFQELATEAYANVALALQAVARRQGMRSVAFQYKGEARVPMAPFKVSGRDLSDATGIHFTLGQLSYSFPEVPERMRQLSYDTTVSIASKSRPVKKILDLAEAQY